MKITPSARITRDPVTIEASEIEPLLLGPPLDVEPFAPRSVELRNREGEARTMLIRAARPEEAPALLRFLAGRPAAGEDPEEATDYRDLTAARVYAEILGWCRRRIKDPYLLLGLCGGELAALADGRLLSREINVAFHTVSYLEGFRTAAALDFARCQYCFEDLGQEELWSTCESHRGWRAWAVELALPSYPWPDLQHELGGGRVYFLTRKYWEAAVRGHLARRYGIEIDRAPGRNLLEKNANLRFPEPAVPAAPPDPVAPAEPVLPPRPEVDVQPTEE